MQPMPITKEQKIAAKVIKTAEEYETALEHISGLMDALPDSAAEDELKLLASLIEQYEREHFTWENSTLHPHETSDQTATL